VLDRGAGGGSRNHNRITGSELNKFLQASCGFICARTRRKGWTRWWPYLPGTLRTLRGDKKEIWREICLDEVGAEQFIPAPELLSSMLFRRKLQRSNCCSVQCAKAE
jgi:hypothetical protein